MIEEEYEKYLKEAEALIDGGYPVPTEDEVELAKIICEERKNINSIEDKEE